MWELGLIGLARAGSMGWFHGHFGGAIIAAQILSERTDLSEEVQMKIAFSARDLARREPRMFQPFPESPRVFDGEARILEAVKPLLAELKNSGHGVIYASLALRALRAQPELATENIIGGIEKLLVFAGSDRMTTRYFTDKMPARETYRDLSDMVLQTVSRSETIYPDQLVGKEYYYFSSEMLHAFTFAQALAEISDLGYEDLARTGFETHRKHLVLSSQMKPPTGEPKQFDATAAAAFSPYLAAYWDRDHFDDHALKFAYAGLALFDRIHRAPPADLWLKFAR